MVSYINKCKKEYEKYSKWCEDSGPSHRSYSRWAKERDSYKKQWEESRIEAFEKRVKSKGVDLEEWLTWAKSLYFIKRNEQAVDLNKVWIVESKAAAWKEEKVWWFPTNIDCLEKVEQLIGYKIHDRNRGHGDIDKDLENIL